MAYAPKHKIKEPRIDNTIRILRDIKKTNDRGMAAILPVRSFVELQGFEYVSGTSQSVRLTGIGMTAILEAEIK